MLPPPPDEPIAPVTVPPMPVGRDVEQTVIETVRPQRNIRHESDDV